MIALYQFPYPKTGLSLSPFCLKLETYLKLAKIPYENRFIRDPRSAPKQKLPFIEEDGIRLADSTLIIDELKKKHGDPLDGRLAPRDRAIAVACQRLLEENLAPAIAYFRWQDAEGWEAFRPVAFKGLPPILSWALPRLIRRGVIKALFAQGLGRHSRSEALAIARKDMAALSEILGAGPYFFGATPCSLDVIAFGVFGTLLANQRETCPLRALASEFPNLVAHCQRLRELAWDRAAAA